MIHIDPKERPTVEQIKDDPWFAGIEWDDVTHAPTAPRKCIYVTVSTPTYRRSRIQAASGRDPQRWTPNPPRCTPPSTDSTHRAWCPSIARMQLRRRPRTLWRRRWPCTTSSRSHLSTPRPHRPLMLLKPRCSRGTTKYCSGRLPWQNRRGPTKDDDRMINDISIFFPSLSSYTFPRTPPSDSFPSILHCTIPFTPHCYPRYLHYLIAIYFYLIAIYRSPYCFISLFITVVVVSCSPSLHLTSIPRFQGWCLYILSRRRSYSVSVPA